jgi:hypothetical protein
MDAALKLSKEPPRKVASQNQGRDNMMVTSYNVRSVKRLLYYLIIPGSFPEQELITRFFTLMALIGGDRLFTRNIF